MFEQIYKICYTTDEHCERLLRMLELKHPCSCCPASTDFRGDNHDFDNWEGNQCTVCREFVGIDPPQLLVVHV